MIAPALLRPLLVCLLLGLAGCRTFGPDPGPVTLRATGDPGVTFRIVSSAADTPAIVASVPATLHFGGSRLDLRCVHGPEPGRLSLSVQRDGFHLATGDTTQPGQVTVFEIRRDSISARSLPPEP